ncbi:MAG: NifU family protein [Solirubrobacteraceae bacterium]
MGTSAASSADGSELLIERVQELQEALDASGDSATRALAEELVSAVLALYGEGLERIVGMLGDGGEDGARLGAQLAGDPLVSTLLLIHDLHPVPLEDRVRAALESVRPYMESHGGNVELVSLQDGVARINLKGSCSDCSASAVTLELAIKRALEDTAPDLTALEVEGAGPQVVTGVGLPMASNDQTGRASPVGIQLPVLSVGGLAAAVPAPSSAWFDVELDDLVDGRLATVSVRHHEIVVANVDGTLLAYEDLCAACGEPLRDGTLVAGALTCPNCGCAFSLPRAGRSIGGDSLQLRPVPLLRERGSVKVALAG